MPIARRTAWTATLLGGVLLGFAGCGDTEAEPVFALGTGGSAPPSSGGAAGTDEPDPASGGAPADCPDVPPRQNAACSGSGRLCTYSNDLRCACFNESWVCERHDEGCPSSPARTDDCRLEPHEACLYSDRLCRCYDERWFGCVLFEAACPAAQPEIGDECTGRPLSFCTYGSERCFCDGDLWRCAPRESL